MCHRYCGGTLKVIGELGEPEKKLQNLWQTAIPEIIALCNEFAFHSALEKLFLCIGAINVYIEERSPWKLAKSPSANDTQLVETTIALAAECLRSAAILLHPTMPTVSQEILAALGDTEKIDWIESLKFGNSLAGHVVKEKLILFPKIDEE
jgi:methionyl-tRNA synthetase